MINDEILSSSLMYNIRIQAEQIYPNVLEEFEKQKESIENLNEDDCFTLMALIPGSSFPSRYSSMAPPPVKHLTLFCRLNFLTAATKSPPPTKKNFLASCICNGICNVFSTT